MTNAELIKALRCESCMNDEHPKCESCEYGAVSFHGKHGDVYGCDARRIDNDAASALEAADKRIAELEKQAEHTDQVDAMILATHLKQAARIAELEAQMPKEGVLEAKKPKTVKETGYSFYCDCPTCGGRLISNVDGEWCAGSFDRFCRMCGQKIDWSEIAAGRICRVARR